MRKALTELLSTLLVVFTYLYSIPADAMTPATTEQMVCVPAVFLVASVADGSSASIPEECVPERFFRTFHWPLTIKVVQVIAERPSKVSQHAASGDILSVRVKVRSSRTAKEVVPDHWQGALLAPFLSAAELTHVLRGKKFIFGLNDFGDDTSQIWSTSFQAELEKLLLQGARNEAQPQPCAQRR
ncbi:hypothetical protein C2U70_17455 [Bradyrhizobium guangdongense]|uniref:hypothetical protein n=1 Tax=Bradyrhizobium guangdongense TaxID=1325090 RepID=UPI00112E524D|nr:hypothetical protein [Bradyrhizobium guangdongense]TPQ34288.1 hypothetical protein C2U70_17455 [Bradyrhizobium guangdongense]